MGTSLPSQAASQDARPVSVEVGSRTLEGGYGGVKSGELLLDLGHDAVLFA